MFKVLFENFNNLAKISKVRAFLVTFCLFCVCPWLKTRGLNTNKSHSKKNLGLLSFRLDLGIYSKP